MSDSEEFEDDTASTVSGMSQISASSEVYADSEAKAGYKKRTKNFRKDPTKPRKKRRNKHHPVFIGQLYRLRDQREGECKFIGETQFADGEWIGIALSDAWEGKNDGEVKNKRYFKCKKGQGVFVRRKQIDREIKTVKKNLRVRDIGKNKAYKVAKYTEVAPLEKETISETKPTHVRRRSLGPRDIGKFDPSEFEMPVFKEAPKNKTEKPEEKVKRALGPRDIGRDQKYEMPKFKEEKTKPLKDKPQITRTRSLGPRDFGIDTEYEMPKFKPNKPKKAKEPERVARAPGPRDIGKADDYEMPKFKSSKTKKKTKEPAKVKRAPGPRDIGKADDYEMPKFKKSKKKKKKEEVKKEKKLGPRDIGKDKAYIMPKFKSSKKTKKEKTEKTTKKKGSDFVLPQWKSSKKSKSDLPQFKSNAQFGVQENEDGVEKQLGPRDIGKNKGYKTAKYDIDQPWKIKPKEAPLAVEKKLGPREIGKMKYDAAKFDLPDDGDFLQERLGTSGTNAEPVKKMLGPRDIGRNKDYDAAEFELPEQDGSFLQERVTVKTSDAPAEKKLGPRDIGRMKYDAAKFEVKDDGDFLAERLATSKSTGVVSPKAGPRDIGRHEDFDAAKYEIKDDGGDLWAEKVSKTKSEGVVQKQLGPRDIGRNKNYKPKQFKAEEPEEVVDATDSSTQSDALDTEDSFPAVPAAEEPEVEEVAPVAVEEQQEKQESVDLDTSSEEPFQQPEPQEQQEEAEEEEVKAAEADQDLGADHKEEEVALDDDSSSSTEGDIQWGTVPLAAEEEVPSLGNLPPVPKSPQKTKETKPQAKAAAAAPAFDKTEFPCGLYVMTRDTIVRLEIGIKSKQVSRVTSKVQVDVQEVGLEGSRVRARIKRGWFTLKNMDNGKVFAKCVRPRQDYNDSDSVDLSSDEEEEATRPEDMSEWENDDVLSWIETMPSLRKYREDFEIGEVDGDDLLAYNEEDLEGLGIASSVHRKLLLSAVKKYRA